MIRGTVTKAAVSEDWKVLFSFLPENWKQLAADTGALKGLRKDKSPETLLRILLIYLGCGHSLRETVVRARQSKIAELSDVALLKRLRKSQNWLYELCRALFQENGIAVSDTAQQMYVFGTTVVNESGKTGSQWRVYYSMTLPSFACNFFKLMSTRGKGSAETLEHFPVHPGDYILADRGYFTAKGLEHVAKAGGYVTVRLNAAGTLHLEEKPGIPFNFLSVMESITCIGEVGEWHVNMKKAPGITGRVCVLRKTEEAARDALRCMDQDARRKNEKHQESIRSFAHHVAVFTTFPSERFLASDVLESYRLGWQVELVLKRFNSLAQFGHLPKSDEESSKAWFYGKLLVALLTEKIIRHAQTTSPWGYGISASSLERLST